MDPAGVAMRQTHEAPVPAMASRGLWLACLTLALIALPILADRLALLPLHVALNPNEGWNALHTEAWRHGRALYLDPSGPVLNNYPPLSFALVALLSRLTGDLIIAGRILSLVSLVTVAVLSGVIVRPARRGASMGVVRRAVLLRDLPRRLHRLRRDERPAAALARAAPPPWHSGRWPAGGARPGHSCRRARADVAGRPDQAQHDRARRSRRSSPCGWNHRAAVWMIALGGDPRDGAGARRGCYQTWGPEWDPEPRGGTAVEGPLPRAEHSARPPRARVAPGRASGGQRPAGATAVPNGCCSSMPPWALPSALLTGGGAGVYSEWFFEVAVASCILAALIVSRTGARGAGRDGIRGFDGSRWYWRWAWCQFAIKPWLTARWNLRGGDAASLGDDHRIRPRPHSRHPRGRWRARLPRALLLGREGVRARLLQRAAGPPSGPRWRGERPVTPPGAEDQPHPAAGPAIHCTVAGSTGRSGRPRQQLRGGSPLGHGDLCLPAARPMSHRHPSLGCSCAPS